MNNSYKEFRSKIGERRVLVQESLAKYSSFRIGGPSDLFYRAQTKNEIIEAVRLAKKLEIPFFVLGGGTNLLVGDSGFRGLIIKNDTNNIKIIGIKGSNKVSEKNNKLVTRQIYIESDSGVPVNRLVRFTLDQSISGLEMFLGQPGTVGGAVYINAHNINYSSYFSNHLTSAKILDRNGEVEDVDKEYFHFGYDQSILQKNKKIVLTVIFKLETGEKEVLWEKAHQTLLYRQKTQPYGVFTSGCTFRNIALSDAMRLSTPKYTCSAGYLIDAVGLKGVMMGGAKFSEHHANFIINTKDAKASDVLKLIKQAKEKVKNKFGVELTEEIVMVGFK